ncbi:mechanosensitive ion channel [Candidatus Woesearchaeota archaeon]|nr:mechanosensitive ion channel [Candidatus Woesearchaeota archaeon]
MDLSSSLAPLSVYLKNLFGAIIVLFLGLGLGIFVKKLLHRILKEIELNKIMSKVNVTYDLERWVSSILSYVIYLVTFVLSLAWLGIKSLFVLYILVGAIFMLLILTTVVGLKDVIPNFIGWIFLQKKTSGVKEGRNIEVKEISGIVEKIGYLETEIRTEHGDVLYVPNALFLKSKHKVKKL